MPNAAESPGDAPTRTRYPAHDTLVLCYHALSETFPAALSTTPARFERHLDLLARRGYRGVTFSEAVSRPVGRTVAVTFDDAYQSVLELGLPILGHLGWPGTMFAPTDFIGSPEPMCWPGIEQWLGGPHERELLPMSWGDLAELAGLGWEVGSHTCSHPRLTRLDDAALARELADSRARCEDMLRLPCPTLAYPYGDVDARVVAATARAGYDRAAALPRRPHSESPLEWPRVGVYGKDGGPRFTLKAMPLVRRLRRRR
jgi:peptidoglycan/xylan/chitin deacetylase (PgdA/CDA1 family)